MRKILLAAAIVALVIVILFSWLAWNDAQFGWAHVIGLGATLLLLLGRMVLAEKLAAHAAATLKGLNLQTPRPRFTVSQPDPNRDRL